MHTHKHTHTHKDVFCCKIKVIQDLRDVFQPKMASDQSIMVLKEYLFPLELFVNRLSYACAEYKVYNGTDKQMNEEWYVETW